MKKFKLTAITLPLLLASNFAVAEDIPTIGFLADGNESTAPETSYTASRYGFGSQLGGTAILSGDSVSVDVQAKYTSVFGIFAFANSSTIATGKEISANVGFSQSTPSDIAAFNIFASGTSTSINVGTEETEKVNITTSVMNAGTGSSVYGVYSYGSGDKSNVTIKANSVVIDSKTNGTGAYGVYSGSNGHVAVTGNDSVTINASSTSTDENSWVMGIWVDNTVNLKSNGGEVIINAPSVNVNVEGTGNVRGVHVAQNLTPSSYVEGTSLSTLKINADEININSVETGGNSSGLVAMSMGQIYLEGNTTINADDVILARGNAVVHINESGEHSTVLNGNIRFDYDSKTSKTTVDADVLVNLTGENSVWNGSSYVSWGTGKPEDAAKLEVNSLNLALNDGATWNPVTIESKNDETIGQLGLAVNKLDFNDGVINILESTGQEVSVETLTGTGGTINVLAATEDGVTVTSGSLAVNTVEGAPHFTVNALGISSDDITNQQEALESLYSSALSLGDSSDATATLNITEGTVAGALTAEASSDGVSVTETKNSVNSALIDIASSNYLFFRSSINDVSARMGDLRSTPKTAGAWVRYYGGKNKYSDRNMKEKYNTLQIGGDAFVNDSIYIGGTFSYTDGDGTLKNGSTDDKNYSFGIYGGWIGEKGQFVDVIVKRHRIETDFDLYSVNGLSSGSYNNWGTSASVEAGWRLQCPSTGFYAEPQVELQFGRLDSVNYKTSKGVKVEQDGIDSIIGRAGVAVGYTFPKNKGTAYAKASVLHDWKGEVESTFSANGVNRTYNDDLGGTWGEFAVGGTYNPTKNLSAYGQVKTSTGSPVRNPWQVSIGLRYSF